MSGNLFALVSIQKYLKKIIQLQQLVNPTRNFTLGRLQCNCRIRLCSCQIEFVSFDFPADARLFLYRSEISRLLRYGNE